MRICFLATADNPHALRWMRYLARRDHQLLCLCDKPGPGGFRQLPPCDVRHPEPSLLEAAVCFKLWRHRFGWNFLRARAYRRAVREYAPDIVHAMEALAYGYAASRCSEVARVLTPWGNDILLEPKRSRLARWLVTHALRRVEAVTTNMPNLKECVVDEFGVDPERVRPFSWGVDLDVYHPGYEEEVRALRAEWSVPTGSLVFLSIRQMQEYWGIGEIVRAIPEVLSHEPRAFFIFLRGRGDPDYEADLRCEAESAGCAARVRWIDEFLDPTRMAVALNLADAFLSIPRSDLLSMGVLEGMACGAVPIVADLPAYRPRLRHEENAVVVPCPVTADRVAGAMVAVAAHPQWKRRFGERNVALVREHDDWSRNAALMEDVYQWALDHRLRRGGAR